MKIRIEVTAEDIDAALPFCSTCPVALALRRAVGLSSPVAFSEASRFDAMAQPTRLYARGRQTVQCATPKDVRERILEWDRTGHMDPFEFTVEASNGDSAAPFGWILPGGYMPTPIQAA